MSEKANAGIEAWIDNFVRSEMEATSVDRWVERILSRVSDGVPEVRSDSILRETVRSATASHWRAFLTHLGQAEQEFRLVPDAADVATVVAQRGFPLQVILGIYTSAQQEVWRYILSVVDQFPPGEFDEKEVLVHFWTRASAWFDGSVDASVQLYHAELARIQQGDAARRLDAVRAILNGQVTDPRIASSNLGGHLVVGVNTAIVLHAQDHNMVADLGGAATMLTEQLGLRRPLTIHPGGRDLWCWTSSRDEPDLSKLRTAQPWLVAHNIVAAVGAPALGLDGFCSTHRDALAAQVVALHSRTPEALTLFSEVELLTLLTDAEAMARFVARTLGVLAEPGETNERLRETVHTLLISGSVEATARLLTVHKNTVRYRVDRAEELIGRPVTDTPTETELALRWHARFLAPPPS